jgi:hypothetical protein
MFRSFSPATRFLVNPVGNANLSQLDNQQHDDPPDIQVHGHLLSFDLYPSMKTH